MPHSLSFDDASWLGEVAAGRTAGLTPAPTARRRSVPALTGWPAGLGRALACCLVLLGTRLASGREPSWTLATQDTRITITVVSGAPAIRHLQPVHADHDWVTGAAPVPLMPRVWVEGRARATHWTFVEGRRDRAAGTLTLTFSNATPPLRLRSLWRARPGRGPVEHWLEILNRSDRPLTLSRQDSLTLRALHPGGPAHLWWIRRGASNASTQGGTFSRAVTPGLALTLVSDCEDGASPVPWLAAQVGEEHGLYVGWEFSGLGQIAVRTLDDRGGLRLAIGTGPEFRTDLGAGETFLVPPAFVGCYTGDLDDGSYSLHRWVIDHLRPPMPPGVADPTLAYNLYLDAGGPEAREADVLRSAALCRDLGFETFMPDAMWFPECGDWRWDPRRFPRGGEPIERFVHGAGMQFALWCAWSNGGISAQPGALSVRGPTGHPEWFATDFAPGWKPGPFYGGRLCLGCPEAKAWAVEKTQWLVGHNRLDYLKHDIGPIVTHCNQTTHRHHHGVDTSYWAALGYYEVQERLRQAFPRLILEDCSGGGHLKDYGAVARAHYVVTTDTLSNLPDRQSLYDSTFALPPLVLQAYTYDRQYHVPGDDPDAFLWRSAMMGAWQIDPTDTRRWTPQERDSVRQAVATYKTRVRPLLRDVEVHHVLPRPDGVHWDGLFYWSPTRKRGVLFVFRPDAPEDERRIRLKGLAATNRYQVSCQDGSTRPGLRTGADLMDHGLRVRLPERYHSDLVFVEATADRLSPTRGR